MDEQAKKRRSFDRSIGWTVDRVERLRHQLEADPDLFSTDAFYELANLIERTGVLARAYATAVRHRDRPAYDSAAADL